LRKRSARRCIVGENQKKVVTRAAPAACGFALTGPVSAKPQAAGAAPETNTLLDYPYNFSAAESHFALAMLVISPKMAVTLGVNQQADGMLVARCAAVGCHARQLYHAKAARALLGANRKSKWRE